MNAGVITSYMTKAERTTRLAFSVSLNFLATKARTASGNISNNISKATARYSYCSEMAMAYISIWPMKKVLTRE